MEEESKECHKEHEDQKALLQQYQKECHREHENLSAQLRKLAGPKESALKIFYTVIITLFIYALLSSFPIPAPDMKIVSPQNHSQPADKTFDIQVNISDDWFSSKLNYLDFDSEFPRRILQHFSLDPKLWVVLREQKCLCDDWYVYERLDEFHQGTVNAPMELFASNEDFDIAVISVNSNDDQHYQGYLDIKREANSSGIPFPFPASGHVLSEILMHAT